MRKMKVFTAVLIACLVVFNSVYTALAAVYIEDWGFRFEKTGNSSAYEINKYIGDGATVNIPNNYNGFPITSVGEYAFINTSISSVALGDNVVEIKNGAFINVISLTEVTLNNGLTIIGNLAFAGCTGLTELVIPSSVTDIADDSFLNCDSLVIHCFTDSYAHEYAVAHEIPFVLIDAPQEFTFILGDADGDGIVTIIDATKVQRVLAGLDPDDDGMIALRSVTESGEPLNIMDATRIQRYLAGFVADNGIGTEVTRVKYYQA